VEQPDGYVTPGKAGWVLRFKKRFYVLVQAGGSWNEYPDTHMESVGYPATEGGMSKAPGTGMIL
jgi:hypothetical protein